MKKENRRQRIVQRAASGSQDLVNSQNNDGNKAEEQAGNDDSSEELLPTPESTPACRGKAKARSRTIKTTRRDMYKAFDGSALLCIGTFSSLSSYLMVAHSVRTTGILLQSHIAASLVDNMPDN